MYKYKLFHEYTAFVSGDLTREWVDTQEEGSFDNLRGIYDFVASEVINGSAFHYFENHALEVYDEDWAYYGHDKGEEIEYRRVLEIVGPNLAVLSEALHVASLAGELEPGYAILNKAALDEELREILT